MTYARHQVAPGFEGLLGRTLAGQPLSREDGYRLIQAQASELSALMMAASLVRGQGRDRTVTYSRKVFIPLTNLCRQKCSYCTFSRRPEDPLAHTMTPDEVLAVAEAGRQAGCKEALFSLGEKPEEIYDSVREDLAHFGHDSTISYLREMCERVLFETGLLPHANPGIMSCEELASLRGVTVSMGLMLETISERLTGPEMAHHNCPGKHPQARIETIRSAGELDIPFTTGILVGIGETREERVDSLFAILELHKEYGHIQEVIIQNFRVKEDTPMRHADEPSVLEMLRTIATARLILGPAMNIQAPPNLTPDAYGLYLLAGINDWGGVSPLTRDFINPEAPWPKILELRKVTEDAGFQLRERLALYPEFATCDRFLRESCRDRIQAWTEESGLVRWEAQQW
ncbi:MAG: 7,8-didemethyl-8-hydroxy-5-deazariboflavin synthase CofG [Dehalococcoidia bacterium]